MTINELEQLLERMRAQEAARAADHLAKVEKRYRDEAAAKAAEDARKRSEWWAQQKAARLRVVIPRALHGTSHFEFGNHKHRWTNHRGELVIGPEFVMVEAEGDERDERVIYLPLSHFRQLAMRDDRWRQANPGPTEQMLATMPRNAPSVPQPYHERA